MKKKLIVVAAAGALTAAAAVPALALENEFHGMMAVRAYNSNYLAGTAGAIAIDGDTKTTKTWVEQRARLFYSAKANDNLKLVTGFELDSYWGKDSYDSIATRRNSGGALGSDSVSIETKWTYLDFNDPFVGANFKVGMQGLNDAYKGLVVGLGADAAGLLASKSFGSATAAFGWFRLDDANAAARTATTFTNGKQTRDLWILDGSYAISKDLKVGASYYFLNNDNVPTTGGTTGALTDYNVHIFGARAAANLGIADVDGFLIYEAGTAAPIASGNGVHVNAYAANVATSIKAGPGKVKVNALYVSGNNQGQGTFSNNFISINNTTSAVFSENGLAAMGGVYLLVRNPKETTNEQAMSPDSSNLGQGIIGGSVGYDAAFGKAFANANVGMLACAKEQTGRESKYMGTEINGEIGYNLYDNMKASFRAAYVVLGDYYKNKSTMAGMVGTTPANPYETQIVLSYTF